MIYLVIGQDEYVKAYYAALLQRQREQEVSVKKEEELPNSNPLSGDYGTSNERQVGMKSKREDEDDGDDVEWEEEATAGEYHYLLAQKSQRKYETEKLWWTIALTIAFEILKCII